VAPFVAYCFAGKPLFSGLVSLPESFFVFLIVEIEISFPQTSPGCDFPPFPTQPPLSLEWGTCLVA